ncbi:hypothetical protein CKAH01_18747 [Colletotrichum kahawae]|uniref:F-box domain-containing protein n=1 Tax=Colletotrichum kahawae TaxID=34407 RepID=A0AAD9Y5Y8_COLKA|nr:hypothetical protein CKAH01_18747 [Colletotrichum kahawae]
MILFPYKIRTHPWLASRPLPIPEARTRDVSEKTCVKVPEGYVHAKKSSIYMRMKRCRPFLRLAYKLWPKTGNAPRIVNGYLLSGFAIIEVIPVEIISIISSYLALEESVALALTSKMMLSKVGYQTFVELNRCAVSRFKLFLQLEKEIYDMKEILCHRCQVFHPPTSSILKGNGSNRPCAERSPSQRDRSASSPYLPTKLHFNMVKAVMRSCRYSLNLYDPRVLSSNSLYVDETTNAKARYTATSIIADNQLLLRTVITLLPSPIRGKARSAAPNLLKLIKKKQSLSNVCPHIQWSRVYPHIFQDRPPRPPLGLEDEYPDAWNSKTKPFINRGCYDTCKYCSTLFHFSYRDLAISGARVVSLVSYKFLGNGEDLNDRVWMLHTQEATEEAKKKMRISTWWIYPLDAWYREKIKLPEYSGRGYALDPIYFQDLDTVAS